MLTLNDGRSELWQWDTGRTVSVDADCSQVHFSNKVFGRSIDVDVVDGVATIPDILLQTDKELTAWAFVGTPENGYTKISKVFKVNRRNKPADYVFTPPDQTSLEEIKEKIEYLESIQDPDTIKNAVDDYLANNPIKVNETDPTVPDWAKQPNPPDVKIPDKLPNPYSITFTGAVNASYDGSKSVEIKIPDSGGNVEPMEDDIPKVFFGGALPQTKDDTIMSFRYISKTKDISGYCKTKAQGDSSMGYPKKNQTVKLYADVECTEKLKVNFKGWGEQNKFCFKANWIDLIHARNVVSARLWGDVVKTRTNYAELPELLRTSPNHGAVDGFPVKVYANGIYQGRYTINIPKDAWMANMDNELDTHCILCGENYVSGCFRAEANIDESDWTDEVHDTVPASIKTRWNEVIRFVMNSTDEEFVAGIGDYFDVESLIDYYIFGLATCGLDGFGKNQLYMTYDGQKWYATVYDMDSTWGLWWDGSSFVATDYARAEYQDFKDGNGNLLYIRLESLFFDSIKERWNVLKNGALSVDNVTNRFERFTDIAPPYLVAEDYAKTTANGAFVAIPSQTTNNIQQIRAFARERYNWTNGYLTRAGSIGLVNGVFENEHFNITVTNGNHVAIEKLSTPNASINGPISDIRMMQDAGSTEIGNVAHDAIFTIPANGTITVNIKNSTIDTENVWVECTVFLVKPDGTNYGNATVSSLADHWNQSYFTGSVTVPSDTEIGALGLYVGRTEQTFGVEFDLEVFVNGEQYV